ncbi:forkhead box protein H1-like [Nelusetta ayraudi]|uniref:forkhead box protein H1-like n=1 Tax=Nelusetta ayraudi TaxID=303726 RepID=UPI003F71A347
MDNLRVCHLLSSSDTSEQQLLLGKSATYLAMIAVVLQLSPRRMLTVSQLMEKLKQLVDEKRRSIEGNVRVCLTTNKCFVKVPVDPDCRESKRNYWKLDTSHISAKMVRRHFKGLLQLFPELADKLKTENVSTTLEPAACRDVQKQQVEGKFSGPFSIEALLKRDQASPQQQQQQEEEEQQQQQQQQQEPLLLQASAFYSPLCPPGGSPHRGLSALAFSWIVASTQASFPVYISTSTSAPPNSTSPHSSYKSHSVPTFTHNAPCFYL